MLGVGRPGREKSCAISSDDRSKGGRDSISLMREKRKERKKGLRKKEGEKRVRKVR